MSFVEVRHAYAGVLAAILLAAGVAACGSAPSSTRAGSGSPAGTSFRVSIPITIVRGPQGNFLAVRVSVGGGRPVPMMLDTGGPFLQVLPSALGPHVRYRSSSQLIPEYPHPPVTGRVISASVSIEGARTVTTPRPIRLLAVSSFGASLSVFQQYGLQGDIGIGQLAGSSSGLFSGLFSPLVQLASPLSNGFTIQLSGAGGPKLILGTPERTASSVSVPLLPRVSPGVPFGGPGAAARYPNGLPTHQGFVTLCWQIAGERACGPTYADTGDPHAIVGEGLMPNLPTIGQEVKALRPGLPVTISTPAPSNRVVRTFITRLRPPRLLPIYVGAAPLSDVLGTGIGLYLGNAIGYDLTDGQLVITPDRVQ
jgi:hypothetical protein